MKRVDLHRVLLVAVVVLGVAACGRQDSQSNADPSEPNVSVTLPDSIVPDALPAGGTLSATVSSSCVAGGAPQALINDGSGNFTGTLSGVAVGNCTFTIVFMFQDPDFGAVELVTASQTINVGAGSTNLEFGQGDYAETDTDGDGVPNLDELDDANRSDPTTRPLWGEAAWGLEKWTAGP